MKLKTSITIIAGCLAIFLFILLPIFLSIEKKENAVLCTGFPVRFESENDLIMQNFFCKVRQYAKVRMLGSAAISLVNIAKGTADVYSEQNIMLGDVAAGLAIVEGAGGSVNLNPRTIKYSLDVYASNRILSGPD